VVVRITALFVLLSVASQGAFAAGSLEARVDRSVLNKGETLVLELVQRGDDSEPNVSPLSSNFEVLSTGRSTQMSIVNGTIDSSTVWRYTLSPLRSGNLVIPAISSGSTRSETLSIKVNRAGSAPGSGGEKGIFLEVDVDKQNPYVQAQVVYTVRIFRARDFFDGALSEPKSDDFVHRRLGEDTSYKSIRDGIRYTVIQRKYVLFAQKSGKVTVPSIVLSASISTKSTNLGSFGGVISQKRPVRLRSSEIVLDVRPAATAFSGKWWLPTKSLDVTDSWSDSTEELRVGNPITRTISIRAEGVLRGQLPPLSMPEITGLKIYSDQPELSEKPSGDGLAGQHTERWAIIPSRAGEYSVPELRVSWWDVNADRQKFAVLPAKLIRVLPAIGVNENGSSGVLTDGPSLVTGNDHSKAVDGNSPAGIAAASVESSYWLWVVVLLLTGWAATALFLLHKLRDKSARKMPRETPSPRCAAALKQLKLACGSGDLLAIKQAALQWAAALWPNDSPLNLVELASRLDDRNLSKVLSTIDAAIYSGNQTPKVTELGSLATKLAGLQKKISARGQVQDSPLPEF